MFFKLGKVRSSFSGPCSPQVWKSPKAEIPELLWENCSSASSLSLCFSPPYIQYEFPLLQLVSVYILVLLLYAARWICLCLYDPNLEDQLTNSLDYDNQDLKKLLWLEEIKFIHRLCANSPKLHSSIWPSDEHLQSFQVLWMPWYFLLFLTSFLLRAWISESFLSLWKCCFLQKRLLLEMVWYWRWWNHCHWSG